MNGMKKKIKTIHTFKNDMPREIPYRYRLYSIQYSRIHTVDFQVVLNVNELTKMVRKKIT